MRGGRGQEGSSWNNYADGTKCGYLRDFSMISKGIKIFFLRLRLFSSKATISSFLTELPLSFSLLNQVDSRKIKSDIALMNNKKEGATRVTVL